MSVMAGPFVNPSPRIISKVLEHAAAVDIFPLEPGRYPRLVDSVVEQLASSKRCAHCPASPERERWQCAAHKPPPDHPVHGRDEGEVHRDAVGPVDDLPQDRLLVVELAGRARGDHELEHVLGAVEQGGEVAEALELLDQARREYRCDEPYRVLTERIPYSLSPTMYAASAYTSKLGKMQR